LQLTNLARFVAEIANLPCDHKQAYVGSDAFGHKAGLHASAISKCPGSYNHINPELVGNTSSVSVSELSGRSNVLIKAKEFGINLSLEQIKKVLSQVETLENKGFQFEGVDGSLKLMMLRQLDSYAQPFEVLSRQVSSRQVCGNDPVDSATVKLKIKNGKEEEMLCGADGDGPVNALDIALRKALVPHFPYLEKTKLVDYKVRVLPGEKGTAKAVRVLIDFSDGIEEWTMVGCSTDLIYASLQALLDGFEYAILKAL
jgi:2-isopropylmalate synthase